ncbi:phosphotransferase [Paenibacillus alkalitolerans]|uniref:phosphotransferase n=1 Tax=Paenibacillus alkalitolerans TaxID=2799335 RepID=UPI002D7F6D72|nr:phosphotransferase [Paenibacillus alkalitolerans]
MVGHIQKGALIGKGMTAEVYEWQENKILKLYYDWCKPEMISHEAEIAKAVKDAGVPAPAVYEIVEECGRNGIVFDRIRGSSMLAIMQASPWRAAFFARTMAKLHSNIHCCSGAKLPRQKVTMERAIRVSFELLKETTETICKVLHDLPDGSRICHGDLHPDNILMTGSESIAIDWTNACTGDPAGDAARTCLMFRTPFIPPGTSKLMALPIRLIKNILHTNYLEEYRKLTKVKLAEIEAWMLPVAAARLRENVPGEREWLLDLIDRRLLQLER